jgi:hypothetical protein
MTQHVATHDNTNVFVYNPLWLPVVLLLPFARRNASARRVTFLLVTFAGVLTAFGVVAPFLPGFNQGSFAVIALAAPVGLAAAWILREKTRPEPLPTT